MSSSPHDAKKCVEHLHVNEEQYGGGDVLTAAVVEKRPVPLLDTPASMLHHGAEVRRVAQPLVPRRRQLRSRRETINLS